LDLKFESSVMEQQQQQVNINLGGRPKKYHSDEERLQAHKEVKRRYYQEHKEERLAKSKKYYMDHIDHMREYGRQYYYENKGLISQ
jgi:hypothetical protein